MDVKFVGSTSQGNTGFLIHISSAMLALTFLARRIQPFLSLDNCVVECLCTNDSIVLHLLGIFIFNFYFFSEEKSQLPGFELTSQRVKRLRSYQMSYQEKKEKKKRKTLDGVDPETLFMRNSKLIYCPKTCIA